MAKLTVRFPAALVAAFLFQSCTTAEKPSQSPSSPAEVENKSIKQIPKPVNVPDLPVLFTEVKCIKKGGDLFLLVAKLQSNGIWVKPEMQRVPTKKDEHWALDEGKEILRIGQPLFRERLKPGESADYLVSFMKEKDRKFVEIVIPILTGQFWLITWHQFEKVTNEQADAYVRKTPALQDSRQAAQAINGMLMKAFADKDDYLGTVHLRIDCDGLGTYRWHAYGDVFTEDGNPDVKCPTCRLPESFGVTMRGSDAWYVARIELRHTACAH